MGFSHFHEHCLHMGVSHVKIVSLWDCKSLYIYFLGLWDFPLFMKIVRLWDSVAYV